MFWWFGISTERRRTHIIYIYIYRYACMFVFVCLSIYGLYFCCFVSLYFAQLLSFWKYVCLLICFFLFVHCFWLIKASEDVLCGTAFFVVTGLWAQQFSLSSAIRIWQVGARRCWCPSMAYCFGRLWQALCRGVVWKHVCKSLGRDVFARRHPELQW